MLLSAEYIDNSIGKLCHDTSKQFEQQNYITSIIEGDYVTVTPFIRNYKGDTIRIKNFPTYRIRVYGGHRANVSTGISFSFGGMVDDDFFIKKTESVATKFTINKTSEKIGNLFIPSLTTFLHLYNRNSGNSNLQSSGTIGLSVNPTSLESLRVMAGYSLIFGEEKRGVISVGIIGGSVSKLNPRFDENKAYAYSAYDGLQETEIVEKRFRLGGFFGLSYNLSKKR